MAHCCHSGYDSINRLPIQITSTSSANVVGIALRDSRPTIRCKNQTKKPTQLRLRR
ncbi:hypothetical protein RB4232 [Rhodopirellula baltica SH 1]|uniref:Uncharacterized protein n=1 Tax=Rhodopirellula baltica (strain DSM 10527 / NCIMB 13988 / SH1) TaxID=243090 RepID=Q7USY2_RHOBA|nr:hypothetical protein RB4232 [Rhodopirellula baltica SH 1]